MMDRNFVNFIFRSPKGGAENHGGGGGLRQRGLFGFELHERLLVSTVEAAVVHQQLAGKS